MHRTVLVDVDTQVDFMASTGALYVPGAEGLAANLATLMDVARRSGVPHLATLDTHTPDDPEFAAYGFPAHCVVGTPGHAKVAATQQLRPVVLAGDMAVTPAVLAARELAFPKATFDVFTNPAFARTVAALAPRRALVCGVATDYCVKAAVLGLLAMGVPVTLVHDAIAAVTDETGAAARAARVEAGAELATTAEAIARLMTEEVAHVA